MKKYIYLVLWYPVLLYWFIRRPHIEGAGIIVEDENKVLMVRHTYGHRELWGFPGGHKKKHESYITAAQRELKEEVGLDLKLKEALTYETIEDFRYVTSKVFMGKYNRQPVTIQKSEIKEYKWWPKENLPANITNATQQVLKHNLI